MEECVKTIVRKQLKDCLRGFLEVLDKFGHQKYIYMKFLFSLQCFNLLS